MQCVTDLAKLRDSIISRVRCLQRIVSRITTPLNPEDKRAIAFVTIELDNLIIFGLRQYTKSSLLRSRTAAGVRITASVKPSSTEEAAALIYQSLRPTGKLRNQSMLHERDEVVFRDPKRTEKVLMDYNTSNQANFALALALNADVFSEIKICRHFFAHRAKNTYEEVQNFAATLGISRVSPTEHVILRGRPGTGVRLVDGWLADVENFFDLAA